jgi:hypothetical protein
MVTTRVHVSLDHLPGRTATQNRHKHKAASTSTSTSACGGARAARLELRLGCVIVGQSGGNEPNGGGREKHCVQARRRGNRRGRVHLQSSRSAPAIDLIAAT